MVTAQIPSSRCIKKPRRSHQKSRKGCFECKRRRVKCDELRPSCTRCTLLLDKCNYPPEPHAATKNRRDEISPARSSCSTLSPFSDALTYSEQSPSFKASTYPTAPCFDVNCYSTAAKFPESLSDTDLYDHFLQHTSCTLTLCPKDRSALQTNMPKLALQSTVVWHSLLAVSAACLCYDMISKQPTSDTSTVCQILMTGYRHFNLASERMREMISSPRSVKAEQLLASAVLLVPFATSSQQINHWISSRSKTNDSRKPLSTTPRDAIIIMRAIRATLLTPYCDSSSPTPELAGELKLGIDSPITEVTSPSAPLAPSRTHVMVPILAATVQSAFAKLQQRLDSTLLDHSDDPHETLLACSTAFDILKYLNITTFSTSNITLKSPRSPTKEPFVPKTVPLPQIADWLRSFARKATKPLPTEPLTSLLLSFFVQTPQKYLDCVLPLLDQRLEGPIGAISDDIFTELTKEQALALDIYAHWSVLMFLVEEDSWWIGNLPVVTLRGMVNRYGDDFVARLWPGTDSEQEEWWPGSMLSILQTIKRHI